MIKILIMNDMISFEFYEIFNAQVFYLDKIKEHLNLTHFLLRVDFNTKSHTHRLEQNFNHPMYVFETLRMMFSFIIIILKKFILRT